MRERNHLARKKKQIRSAQHNDRNKIDQVHLRVSKNNLK